MQADLITKLRKVLSHERLAAYQKRKPTSNELDLFSRYAWNMALSESLYPGLQALEVALRNTIHNAAAEHFCRVDWYDDQTIIHYRWNINAISKAKEKLTDQNKALEPDRIIAELNFGFWTSLFGRRYERDLWRVLIKPAFPYMPRRIRNPKELSRRLNKIRNLRNRIFHHEPIWYWQDLTQQHQMMLETISFIEPAMLDILKMIDRFDAVHKAGPEAFAKVLKRFC